MWLLEAHRCGDTVDLLEGIKDLASIAPMAGTPARRLPDGHFRPCLFLVFLFYITYYL